MSAPWVEFFPRHMGDGTQEWTLSCSHGSSTSELVKEHFPPEFGQGFWTALTLVLGKKVSETVIALLMIRSLLALLHHQTYGCHCAFEFAKVELPGLGLA